LTMLPDVLQAPVRVLAEQRLSHHLDAGQRARLDAEAEAAGRGRAVDLLVSQGAFVGELAWYAICRLEDEFEPETFAALARHALSCVALPCGWRVPSFITQLLGFLVELGDATEQDVR